MMVESVKSCKQFLGIFYITLTNGKVFIEDYKGAIKVLKRYNRREGVYR